MALILKLQQITQFIEKEIKMKRNHTVPDKLCICTACRKMAKAPPDKDHRKCTQKPKGKWREHLPEDGEFILNEVAVVSQE